MTKLNNKNNAEIWPHLQGRIDAINTSPWNSFPVRIDILREDLLHTEISGNKWRKLKYNILHCIDNQIDTIITVGGNYSNHLAATARACKEFGIKSIGLVRSYSNLKTATLERAESLGMQLEIIPPGSFETDKKKYLEGFPARYHFIEMGGANRMGVLGCEEILSSATTEYDFITVSCGTGTTLSGLINSSEGHQKILGFPAYRSDERLIKDISHFLRSGFSESKFEIIDGYAFGGFGKMDEKLIQFIQSFYQSTSIPLDGVYTGKMMFGLEQMLHSGFFPSGSKILAVHTGGLQGNVGLNKKYESELPVPSF